ncbi:CDP-alcohol phosphatidyltransferase family protein [Tsuneonella sp. HG094]
MLTASGAVLSLLALDAAIRDEFREALLWLLVALAVDGVDGTLARRLRIADRLPRIDGAALDLVVDYLTFVLVPVLIMWRGGFLPAPLALPLCSIILITSLYVFARRDMKTADGYFRGFPALWNVVAAYFVLLPVPAPIAAAIVSMLALLTFAPIHVVHPFRTADSRAVAVIAGVLWVLATAVLAAGEGAGSWRVPAMAISLGSLAALVAIGARRTWRGER